MFLGVLNLNEQFVPLHLAFLRSFMSCRPMNLLFPFCVTGGVVLVTVLVQRAGVPGITAFHAAGLTFVITMLALAVLEHWFLVLPLPFARLWDWALTVRRRGVAPIRFPARFHARARAATP